MKYALNAMCVPSDAPGEFVALAADAGYDGIEPSLSVEGTLIDPEARAEIARAAAEHDLEIPSVLTPAFWEYPLTSTDPAVREQGIEHGTRLVEAADELGAGVALVVPGIVDAETPYDVAYENALDCVRDLAAVADEHDVTLAIENVWNDFLLSPLEFRDFVDAAATAGPVGAYFDVGNVLRFGRPEHWIRILGDRIAAVHVKDYDTEIDTIEGFTYPLQGDVPWEAVIDALEDVAFDGWIAPEVPPYETHGERTAEQVRSNLDTLFARGSRSSG